MTYLRRNLFALCAVCIGLAAVATWSSGCAPVDDPTEMGAEEPGLKDHYRDAFLVGGALNAWHLTGRLPRDVDLVVENFNSITAENAMKWERIHPEPDRYDFEIADSLVSFAERHGMAVIGHTLVWHSQTPRWVFEDGAGNPVTREGLLARMRDHITTVVGRYRGRVAGWDVVNEALNEDGTLRDSPWRRIIGDDYIAKAFEFAREADPDAGLYYNDYSLANPAKRDGAVTLIRSLQEVGAPVTAIGEQGHFQLDWPTRGRFDSMMTAFTGLGVDVMITELDINVLPQGSWSANITDTAAWRAEIDPYRDGLPDSMQTVLAKRYADLFRAFLDHKESISRVTFWGVTDATSWKNNFPIPGRVNYPLLFDRNGEPKPAYHAVVEVATQ